MADGDAPAVAAAVVDADGVRERRLAGDARDDSLFALASLTKPLVAAAFMVAAEEGVVDLDAPVAEHVPAYGDDERRGLTPRHLLAHAGGLPETGPPGVASVDVGLAAPPETRRIYSNTAYNVLGALLEAAAGMPAAEYLRLAVFEPLGMDAALGLPEELDARALDVREPGLAEPGVARFNSRRWRRRGAPAGGAFATLDAYARFTSMLLARGAPLMAEETFDEMAAPQWPGLPGGIESFLTWDRADWSLGLDVRDAKTPHWAGTRTSPTTLSHFGAAGTLAWADLAAGVGLVCLANRGTYGGWPMRPGRWGDLSDAVLA